VNEHRFVNPHQPQPLYSGTILCYMEAFFMLLSLGTFSSLGLFIVGGLGAGGYGIANEKKWGYALAVAAAILNALLYLTFGLGSLRNVWVLISFCFAVLLVALLLHPQSRDYQRIWFK
jgi:hypothetical protein